MSSFSTLLDNIHISFKDIYHSNIVLHYTYGLYLHIYLYVIFFRITDKLLPFDLLSILILDKLCMNLLCLYRYFL